MSHPLVRSSEVPPRNKQRNCGGRKPRVENMKNRFPTLNRTTWRHRFLAIARQAEQPAERIPRRAQDPSARAEIRVRFAALTSH